MRQVRTSKVIPSKPATSKRWSAGATALVPAPRNNERRQREGSPRHGWRCRLGRWRAHRALAGGLADGGEASEQLRLRADARRGRQTCQATAGGGGGRCKWRAKRGQPEHVGRGPGVMARKRSACSMTCCAVGPAAASAGGGLPGRRRPLMGRRPLCPWPAAAATQPRKGRWKSVHGRDGVKTPWSSPTALSIAHESTAVEDDMWPAAGPWDGHTAATLHRTNRTRLRMSDSTVAFPVPPLPPHLVFASATDRMRVSGAVAPCMSVSEWTHDTSVSALKRHT